MKTYINKVTLVTEMTTPDGKTVRVILPESMVLDFSLGVGFKTEIVEELPETGDPRIIYLVPAEDEEEGNVYVEYLYIDGEWECVGSTKVPVNLMIGTEQERLAFVNPPEGMQWNEPHPADPNDAESVATVKRFLREGGQWVDITGNREKVAVKLTAGLTDMTGKVVTVQYIDESGRSEQYTLDANGECSFSVLIGERYRVVFPIIPTYAQQNDMVLTAMLPARAIIKDYHSGMANYEVVEIYAHIISENQSDNTILQGETVKVLTAGGTEYTGTFDNNFVSFQIPYGEQYTVQLPDVNGWQHEHRQIIHTAGLPSREILVHYSQEMLGIFGIDAQGKPYTLEEIQALQDPTIIIAVGVNTSQLAKSERGDGTYGNGFCFKIPTSTSGQLWASANVAFDTTHLPYKSDISAASQDYKGEDNTFWMINLADGLEVTVPAATYCKSQVLNIAGVDREGFLGSFGQMYTIAQNYLEIKTLIEATGRTCPNFTSGIWWTSTQYNATNAVNLYGGGFDNYRKPSSLTTMALFAL